MVRLPFLIIGVSCLINKYWVAVVNFENKYQSTNRTENVLFSTYKDTADAGKFQKKILLENELMLWFVLRFLMMHRRVYWVRPRLENSKGVSRRKGRSKIMPPCVHRQEFTSHSRSKRRSREVRPKFAHSHFHHRTDYLARSSVHWRWRTTHRLSMFDFSNNRYWLWLYNLSSCSDLNWPPRYNQARQKSIRNFHKWGIVDRCSSVSGCWVRLPLVFPGTRGADWCHFPSRCHCLRRSLSRN